MKFDSKQDKDLILDIIGKGTFAGSAVFVIADLIQRVQKAGVEEPKLPPPPKPETQEKTKTVA